MPTTPTWVDKTLYPFTSHWVSIDNNTIHYIDEGQGHTILFVHGTPEWSFGYRDVIKNLRTHYRCVALDLLGFGLSDKPATADYSCAAHAQRLTRFIETLGLKNFTLVANDFGGSIGLSYVLDHATHVNKIILFNTWMRSLASDSHYARPAKVAASAFGRFLYLTFNFPVNVIMPAAYGDKRKLTREIHQQYKNALPKGQRTAAHAFAKELLHANAWWQARWERLDELNNKQILFFWGLKDNFVPPSELALWRERLSHARYVTYADAGHFVQEEKPEEMAAEIRTFLG